MHEAKKQAIYCNKKTERKIYGIIFNVCYKINYFDYQTRPWRQSL